MEAGGAERPYVGRGGLKLRHALSAFGLEVRGLLAADFGCNVGGFTDCLLRAGAARVYAIDTGYGMLAWSLRNDPRVVVMERTSALHAVRPEGGVGLVAIDLGWTPQRTAIPAALRWLAPGGSIVTLVKPHYEADALARRGEGEPLPRGGVLDASRAAGVVERVLSELPGLGAVVAGVCESPVVGGAGKGNARGNREWLALVRAAGSGG